MVTKVDDVTIPHEADVFFCAGMGAHFISVVKGQKEAIAEEGFRILIFLEPALFRGLNFQIPNAVWVYNMITQVVFYEFGFFLGWPAVICISHLDQGWRGHYLRATQGHNKDEEASQK